MSILFYGDPHGEWRPLLAACSDRRPSAVVLLGDCDLSRPLRETIAPVFAGGIRVLWIPGNHESDDHAWHANLFDDHTAGNIHARWDHAGGRIVGGLGGVFRGQVWYPLKGPRDDAGEPEPRIRSRAEYLRALRPQERWRKGVPFRHTTTIFPEDVEAAFDGIRLDVLVTHEAPSCHQHGFGAIDRLAERTRARLVVHGHHHRSYEDELPGGVRVRGLGRAEPWWLEEGA
ncbi:metallophosphoesterase [Siccirubricoccus sp. KC 17139]|uniref:Metallophosphoesterase n=1 Tax=Siccirubricoccus soli TaxID=2899147 RepID=A0ABT1D2C4_9PROT|nr:metallophosphoesterase [Siccirubricoccus soli]MCO6416078.1 metallophosphoesterase [Siccirubricoccus soli]MCP2682210.1 metallophosphoesterase [Siccirubricoccus soli]